MAAAAAATLAVKKKRKKRRRKRKKLKLVVEWICSVVEMLVVVVTIRLWEHFEDKTSINEYQSSRAQVYLFQLSIS